MRIVFAGTPAFAASALIALVARGVEVVSVLTQPDRPAGRGLKPSISAVKQAALARGLCVLQPPSLRDPAWIERLTREPVDAWVVAAYGLLLPQPILDAPRLGCLNIHASLLPRWRGAAPIQRALLAGDRDTGITIMRMDAGLDTGPILLERSIAIGADDTSGSLHDRLARLGAELICEALDRTERGELVPRPQPVDGATYAAKIDKREALIDWHRPAAELDRLIRAMSPVPGAQTTLDGAVIKLWRAHPVEGSGAPPGMVCDHAPGRLTISCGVGALSVAELQRSGGRRLPVDLFLRGTPVSPSARFGA